MTNNEAKIRYLKEQLDRALQNENADDVTACWAELKKYKNETDLSAYASRAAGMLEKQSADRRLREAGSMEKLQKEADAAIAGIYRGRTAMRALLLIGTALAVLGFLMVMIGGGVVETQLAYNDFVMYGGLGIVIFGDVLLISAAFPSHARRKNESGLEQCLARAFANTCDSEPRLRVMTNAADRLKPAYRGSMGANGPEGFGVGVFGQGIYTGEWKDGLPSGVGSLVTPGGGMTIDGEFTHGKPDGTTDIFWADGQQWHGTYRAGRPYDGSGKAFLLNGATRSGFWSGGIYANAKPER